MGKHVSFSNRETEICDYAAGGFASTSSMEGVVEGWVKSYLNSQTGPQGKKKKKQGIRHPPKKQGEGAGEEGRVSY